MEKVHEYMDNGDQQLLAVFFHFNGWQSIILLLDDRRRYIWGRYQRFGSLNRIGITPHIRGWEIWTWNANSMCT